MGFCEQNVGLVMRSLKCFSFTHWLQLYIDLSQFGQRPLLHAFIVNTICFTKDCRLTEFSLKPHIVLKLGIKALVLKRNVLFVYWFIGAPEVLDFSVFKGHSCSPSFSLVSCHLSAPLLVLIVSFKSRENRHIFYLGVLLVSQPWCKRYGICLASSSLFSPLLSKKGSEKGESLLNVLFSFCTSFLLSPHPHTTILLPVNKQLFNSQRA